MIPCYVGGKGRSAGVSTREFKVTVFDCLEKTGLGYDTRYRYYRPEFAGLSGDEFARMVCGPIEGYDRQWAELRERNEASTSAEALLTEFVLEKDSLFLNGARAAIFCYDEAGLGTGVNSIRFLQCGKPLLGFLHRNPDHRTVNPQNVLQLKVIHPALATIEWYDDLAQVRETVARWLTEMGQRLG